MPAEFILLGSVVLVGAAAQRLTGVGFALISAPLLVLIVGPVQGVVMTNLLGATIAAIIYVLHAHEVEYRRVLPLLLAAVVALIPGALVIKELSPGILALGSGILILIALALSQAARHIPHVNGWQGLVVAGALSGFMNVIAGVGGPAVAAYAVASRWEQRKFAISIEFYYVILGILSLLARGIAPQISILDWICAIVALALGMLVGHLLTSRVPTRLAQRVCMALAAAGAIAVIIRGLTELGTN